MNNIELMSSLMHNYYKDFKNLIEKEDLSSHVSLSSFQQNQALKINAPKDANWDILESLNRFLPSEDIKNVLIIYSDSKCYMKVYEVLKNSNKKITFISWHEIFTAIQLNQSDIHKINDVNRKLKDSQLTLFLDPPYDVQEVIKHVCAFTFGCLIFLSV